MSSRKYHTIDPLILQTLNLNQRRMNHILDILHGKPANNQQQLKKIKSKKYLFQNSLRQQSNQLSSKYLPNIKQRSQTIEVKKNHSLKSYLNLNQNRKINLVQNSRSKEKDKKASKTLQKNLTFDQSLRNYDQPLRNKQKQNKNKLLDFGRSTDQSQTNTIPVSYLNFSNRQKLSSQKKTIRRQLRQRKSISDVRSKFQLSKISSSLLSPLGNHENQENQLLQKNSKNNLQQSSVFPKPLVISQNSNKLKNRQKTKQVLNDYMGQYTLKKSQSMQVLNSKDIYRLQIQNLISEQTPIQKLQDAQKKMKRVKKRHQHLVHFDKKYYSKLNQMDLIAL